MKIQCLHAIERVNQLGLKICTLVCLMVNPFGYGEAAELLLEGKTAEIKLKVVNVKAGPGKAFIDNGRLYKGDRVTILNKENLSTWVRIESGKIVGFVPLKVLRFSRPKPENEGTSDRIRRLEDYTYDENGKRLHLGSGDRVGSGETLREKLPNKGAKDSTSSQQMSGYLEFGVGQFERRFQSNVEIRSILSLAEAKPIVLTTGLHFTYAWSPEYTASVSVLDYRFGSTELQTPVLNQNQAFEVTNEGQLIEFSPMYHWRQSAFAIGAGPSLHLQRHQFQESEPVPLFLTSTSGSVGVKLSMDIRIPGAQLTVSGDYGTTIFSSQSANVTTPLSNGTLFVLRARVLIPINDRISLALTGLMSSETIERAGESNHIDTVTDPDTPLTYQTSQEVNRLTTALIGFKVIL
ncbi:MAG: hypothetical protein ACPGQS_01400 [Bradymonadia bacterium]